MQRTDDFITNEQSLGKVETKMRTLALSWVDFSLVADDEDGVLIFGSNFKLSDLTLLEVVFSLDGEEVSVVDFGGGKPQSVAC